jgi:hypothetical protein
MSDETTNKTGKTGDEEKNETDKLIEATKKFADKAEDYVSETAKKVKNSETFGKLTEMFNKGKEFVEEKAEEFRSGEMGEKFEAFKEKAASKAEVLIQKAKVAGKEMAHEVDDALDSIKEKTKKGNSEK